MNGTKRYTIAELKRMISAVENQESQEREDLCTFLESDERFTNVKRYVDYWKVAHVRFQTGDTFVNTDGETIRMTFDAAWCENGVLLEGWGEYSCLWDAGELAFESVTKFMRLVEKAAGDIAR